MIDYFHIMLGCTVFQFQFTVTFLHPPYTHEQTHCRGMSLNFIIPDTSIKLSHRVYRTQQHDVVYKYCPVDQTDFLFILWLWVRSIRFFFVYMEEKDREWISLYIILNVHTQYKYVQKIKINRYKNKTVSQLIGYFVTYRGKFVVLHFLLLLLSCLLFFNIFPTPYTLYIRI